MSCAKILSLMIVTSTANMQYTPRAWNGLTPHLRPQIGTQSECDILFIGCLKNLQVYSKTSLVNLLHAIWSQIYWNRFLMLIPEFFSKRLSPVMSSSRFNFALISILISLLINARLSSPNKSSPYELSPNKLSSMSSFTESSELFNIDFWRANFYRQAEVNLDMSKLLSFCEEETNSGEINLFYSALTHLAVFVAVTFNNLFDISIVKILVIAGLTILYLSIRY